MNIDPTIVEKQFDYYCKLVIKNALANKNKQDSYKRLHEKSFSDLSIDEFNSMRNNDNYEIERFYIDGFLIENELLYEALKQLPAIKRKVVMLKFFGEMTDTEIGMIMNLPRTTVQSIRYSALKLLKLYMEGNSGEHRYGRKH